METHKQVILVVDDESLNVDLLARMLQSQYQVKVALSGEKALHIALSDDPPDLILLDIEMPGMNGYDVCARLKEHTVVRKIPVIFVTGRDAIEDETRAFEIGAVDYITKPFSLPVVRGRVKTHLALYDQNRVLEQKVRERTEELVHTRDVTIYSLAALAETRDNETGGHIMRTQHYVRMLAEHLATSPRFRNVLDEQMIDLLFKSAPLHDIGKVGVPDRILLKPGRLTSEEYEEMKKHTLYGRDALAKAEAILTNHPIPSFLHTAREIAYTHHEKWDGSGYPQGLAGEAIPLSGRLMSIADVYDALISKRVYKPLFSHQKAVEIITRGDRLTKPQHFDPDIIAAFLEIEGKFRDIALQFADFDEERVLLLASTG